MELASLKKRLLGFAMGGVLAFGMAAGGLSAQPAYAENGGLAPGTAVGASADGGDDAAVVLKDGTFKGTRYGYRSDVTIAVTVEGGKIVAVECVEQDEDEVYWDKAEVLIDQILEAQSTNLDTVSGATISSRAILRAAQSAIDQSSGNDSTKPASEIFAGGDGTRTNPFLIKTAEQFRAFAKSLTMTVDYEGYYVKLDADIDVSGENWTPVGSTEDNGMLQFQGDFNGDGHTISGLTFGAEETAMEFDANHREIGLFGITGPFAKIHDFAIEGLKANVSCPTTTHFGGVVGNTKPPSGGTIGTCIDGASVSGSIRVSNTAGTQRVGGIAGYQNGGTVIMNSWTDVDISTTDCPSWVQVGAISGISNSGLVVNCYSLGNVSANGASANKVAASLLTGNYGDAVNCYAMGNVVTNVESDCIGAVGGELAEGSAYNNWYNQAATLTVGESAPVELPAVGEVNVTSDSKDNYISSDGMTYAGHMIENNKAFTADQLEAVKGALNASLNNFPMDVENLYGVPADALRSWVVEDGVLTLSNETVKLNYKQPDSTRVPQATFVMKDGTWYGRDADKVTTVKIVTKDNEVVSTEVIAGSNKAKNKASKVAQTKAIYGDASGYGEADTSVFAGGSGTAEDPYLIAAEEQLRYIATAINEDVDWDGVYFKQTADIQLSEEEWLPIGYMIQGYYLSKWQTFASYPFKGNYDGGNFTISGLRIGTESKSSADPRMQVVAGFIGYAVGGVTNNYALKEDSVVREVKNVIIKDALINVAGLSNVYAAGMIAYANNGFVIDRCDVQGAVKASGMETTLELTDYAGVTTTTSAGTKNIYAGGIFGYGLRGGLIKNTAADVDVTASALDGSTTTVYAGGLFGMDNRTTAVNDYALGDVAATAAENRAYVGGLTGYSAGAHYNVYTAGSVSSANASNYVGGTSGIFKMVGADFNVYFNGDAAQTVAGTVKSEPVAYGTQDADAQNTAAAAKTANELASAEFVAAMNEGVKNVADTLPQQISEDPIHYSYYAGNGDDLITWAVEDGKAILNGAGATMGDEKAADVAAEAIAKAAAEGATAEDVAAARAAYDALSDAARALLPEDALPKLEAAEKKVADAAAAAKAAAAKAAAEKAAASNVNTATVTAAQAKKASDLGVTTITLGPKVKKIAKGAFAGTKITTIIVKTKKLKKKSVKGSLKGSSVKTVKVQIGSKKANKKYVKKYKKIFTKKVAGKKAAVK